MRSKKKAWTKRDETLSNTQTELSEVASKLKSL